VRHAVYCANFGRLGDPRLLVDLAERAEQAGWDGFFVYDHIVIAPGRAVPSADPWAVLAAVAARTRLVLGPMVTPLARRQPWEVAHQAVALDALSEGRLVLGAGLGESMDADAFGVGGTPRERADRLDESLGLLRRFWAGEEVTHDGTWRIAGATLAPRPVRGDIPIWVAGRYPNRRPAERAARHDGFFPIDTTWDLGAPLPPHRLAELVGEIRPEREPFDVVTAGVTPPERARAATVVEPYERAGATWWLEIIEPRRGEVDALRGRIEAGPPR
jgi:alkanesulfonate monooxygenase SsuD/methylene tetrahydromethanopterin reductase-like flavin-dependent oxidoreductase (luciferase family)